VFGFPNIIRFSWSTCKESLARDASIVSWDCSDEESSHGTTTITNYFDAFGSKKRKRAGYFSQKKMSQVFLSDFEH